MTGHELYDRLGRTAAARQVGTGALFGAARDEDVLNGLRAAANGGWSLSDARFSGRSQRARPPGCAAKGAPAQNPRGARQLSLL